MRGVTKLKCLPSRVDRFVLDLDDQVVNEGLPRFSTVCVKARERNIGCPTLACLRRSVGKYEPSPMRIEHMGYIGHIGPNRMDVK